MISWTLRKLNSVALLSNYVRLFFAAGTREQSREEEIANSLSHGLGLFAALVATPFLIRHAVRHGEPGFIVGASLYAATMLLLYLASTLYHALPNGRSKAIFRVIEHSAIFLLIAGTYTPSPWGCCAAPGAGRCLASSGALPWPASR